MFMKISDKWHVFLGLHRRRLEVTKHFCGASNRTQLVISPKKVRSSTVSRSEIGGVKREIMSSPA